jgi:hypothetical protein
MFQRLLPEHDSHCWHDKVKEVKPKDAACIIEADVNVDFDAPVGYVEPERIPVAPPKPVLPEVTRVVELGIRSEVLDEGGMHG